MKIVRVGPNPGYKLPKDASSEVKAAWAAIQKAIPLSLPYVSAMENVRNSGGMYAILPDVVVPSASAVRMPEEMQSDELKLTALQLGIDLRKPMKKADLVAAVRKAMDAVQFLDDDSEDEDEAP